MTSPLATEEQLALERRVLAVFDRDEVRAVREQLVALYRATGIAASSSGAAMLDAAVDSVVVAAVAEAVVLDPWRPRFMWMPCAAHRWYHQFMPNSGYGIENPDNVYRHVGVDDSAPYRIEGRLGARPPMDLSFVLYGEVPGTGAFNPEGAPILGILTFRQIDVAPDGTFVITLDASPADGRKNHLTTPPGSQLLIVRDSLADWATEMPTTLTIERADAAQQPAPSIEELAARAAAFASALGRYWGIDYNQRAIYSRPANIVDPPRQRGIGMSVSGHFELADDQALVVTVDPKGARYVGFQLADPWGVALEYVSRNGSLSNAQARPNADGTITYVISPTDPGVWNWLDTLGLAAGIFAIRWQPIAGADAASGAIVDAAVVDRRMLADVLPAGTAVVDAAARERQLADRTRSYRRRMFGD